MLDTGNFVLSTQASVILWQSFDEPTDTLLPTQTLSLGGQLLARYRQKNYSSGQFTFKLNYSVDGLRYQVVFNQSGLLHLVAKNGSLLTDIFSNKISPKQVLYQRVTLDYDGVLRHYVYQQQKSSRASRGWSIDSFDPENICELQHVGIDPKPHCICPPGYAVVDPDDEMSGCFQTFLAQSIDWCREVCLVDCLCAVGIFSEDGECWKKRLPLTHGRKDKTIKTTAIIKVGTRGGLISERRYKKSKRVWKSIIDTSGSANIILLSSIFIGFFFFPYRKSREISKSYNVRSFSYKELNEATNKFSEELGHGAFGVVFKGVLSYSSSSQAFIAVKKLYNTSQNVDIFKTEVNSIGCTHHKNLVKLIGFCEEDEHRLLVYEYMRNGTLSEFLYQHPKPSWEKRMQIAQGIARGLFYLHEHCSTRIIHCDIKPQNILLDDEHNARISDFGLAKLMMIDQTRTYTAPRGTRGYVAPEWFKNIPITAKVDVYSFGILLLEIICCQRNVQHKNNEEEGVFLLTDWAFDCYQMETIDQLVKDDAEALKDKQRLVRMVKIAIWCIQDDPELRPHMRRVLDMLEGLVHVPEPPCPASYSTSQTEAFPSSSTNLQHEPHKS